LRVVPGLGLDGLFPASIGPRDRHGKRPERPWYTVDERLGLVASRNFRSAKAFSSEAFRFAQRKRERWL
jgi:hypothetical protein